MDARTAAQIDRIEGLLMAILATSQNLLNVSMTKQVPKKRTRRKRK
jgi:hypothetical protein